MDLDQDPQEDNELASEFDKELSRKQIDVSLSKKGNQDPDIISHFTYNIFKSLCLFLVND